MKKAAMHRVDYLEPVGTVTSTSTVRVEVLGSMRSGICLLLMVIAICLMAIPAFAGTVVYDYDPTGQLESVRNNADKNIISGSISTGVSNKRLFLGEGFDVFRTVRGRLLTIVCDMFYLTRVTWTMSV